MRKVWLGPDYIVSPLGATTDANYKCLQKSTSGIQLVHDIRLCDLPFYAAKLNGVSNRNDRTRFETICFEALDGLFANTNVPLDKTVLILSTTKGNISFLEEGQPDHPRIHLHAVAAFIAGHYGFAHHLVVSNACVSGLVALTVGKRMLEAGQYDQAVVLGADVLSRFVVSGFQSLHAMSGAPCKPFDKLRSGINLGECAAAMMLTTKPELMPDQPHVYIAGTGLSNDANHISGPSRSGEELAYAIDQAFEEADVDAKDIDFICAHGTATVYNDEMEANAFLLRQLDNVPLNSLKGYYGHTLGGAGVLEIILSKQSLMHDQLIPTFGFSTLGVSKSVNVIREWENKKLDTCLKTASGFGGCNAAIVLIKTTD